MVSRSWSNLFEGCGKQETDLLLTCNSDLFAQKPRFEHPLICGCQGFRIDEAVDANLYLPHQLMGEDEHGKIIENTQILGHEVPKSSERRRKYFSKHENLEKYYFEPAYIYTFEFYSNWFSPMRYRIEVAPFFSFDLVQYFNGCP